MQRIHAFVGCIIVAAVLLTGALIWHSPIVDTAALGAVLVMTVLAVIAEMLTFVLPRSATNSVSYIPYLAAVVLAPSWPTVVVVAAVRALLEPAAKRPLIKILFNSGQHTLTQAVAVIVYRSLGGVGLTAFADSSLSQAALAVGGKALITFSVALLCHSLMLSMAIALSSNAPVKSVWRLNHLTTIGLDLAAGPLIFAFAWIYAVYGWMAIAALWVPLLGLRQVHKSNLDLEQMNQELLQLMVKSIEARDPYTSGHSRRVQHYSMIIARALGLSGNEVERIGRAALLHDVGKIYEKYAPILRKTERLNAQEWATMQEHPIDGANLVSTMSGLKDVVPAVRHHHENWDGTGYPDGLAGELIPLASRIITFADTVDAMTSERPYRKPMSEEQVRAEIVKCRGKQFDPQIADRLLSSPVWKSLFAPAPVTTGAYRILSVVRGQGRRAKLDAVAVNE